MQPLEDSRPPSSTGTVIERRTLILSALAAFACGDDNSSSSTTPSSTTSPSTTTPAATATATPDPSTAVGSSDRGYTWQATFTVTLTETAALVTTVKSLSATLQQAAGGIIITPPTGITETYRYQVRAGTNQIGANGTLPIEFDFFYTLPNGGRQALVTLTFNLTDSNGAGTTVTLQVKVA